MFSSFLLENLDNFSYKIHLSLNTGHGRKRRAIEHEDKNVTEYTKFKENLQYTVLMPGELTNEVKYRESGDQCRNFVMISGLLAGLLALSTIIVSYLRNRKKDDWVVMESLRNRTVLRKRGFANYSTSFNKNPKV